MKNYRAISRSVRVVGLLVGCSNNTGSQLSFASPPISDGPIEYSVIKTKDGVGFIDKTGKVVVEPKFIDVKPFSDGLAAVQVNDKETGPLWGFINHQGQFVIKPQYFLVEPFSDKLALVTSNDTMDQSFIDQRRAVVIAPRQEYRAASGFAEGLAPVGSKGKMGFIDKTGKVVIEPKFDGVRNFSNGLAFVNVGQGFDLLSGYIDQTGRLVLPLRYRGGTDFNDERAVVNQGPEGYVLINKDGQVLKRQINPACNDDIQNGFSEGLIPARVELPGQTGGLFRFDGCGYIDAQGKVAIPPNRELEQVGDFSEGLALVKSGYKRGYMNKSGKMVLPIQYEEATAFKHGLAYVKINAAEEGYINSSGQFVWKPVTF